MSTDIDRLHAAIRSSLLKEIGGAEQVRAVVNGPGKSGLVVAGGGALVHGPNGWQKWSYAALTGVDVYRGLLVLRGPRFAGSSVRKTWPPLRPLSKPCSGSPVILHTPSCAMMQRRSRQHAQLRRSSKPRSAKAPWVSTADRHLSAMFPS